MINDLQIYGATDTGMVRDNNEDTFAALYIDDESKVLCLVIDGMGGYEGGEVAAEITRSTVIDYLRDHREGSTVERLKAALTASNNAIITAANADARRQQMGCVATAAVIDLEESTLTIAHVGDTRLYTYDGTDLVKLTHDHSLVGFREESGQLTEREAMTHPQRNIVERCLGTEIHGVNDDNFLEASIYSIDHNCTLLLCSDGLCDMITSDEMKAELSVPDAELPHVALALIERANRAGGRDNVTVVLARIEVKPEAKPAPVDNNTVIADDIDDNDTEDTDDILADVREPAGNSGRLFTPRNIALMLIPIVLAFFGGYYAAFMQAGKKYDEAAAELDTCRSSLEQARSEILNLNDSVYTYKNLADSLNHIINPEAYEPELPDQP